MELISLALIVAPITRIGDSSDKYGTSDQPKHTKIHRLDAWIRAYHTPDHQIILSSPFYVDGIV